MTTCKCGHEKKYHGDKGCTFGGMLNTGNSRWSICNCKKTPLNFIPKRSKYDKKDER